MSKILLLLLIPSIICGAGRVDADFLRMEPSARTSGMGSAFCGVADDLSAMIFNPAGLVQVTKTSISLTHFSSFADTNCEYIGGAMPVGAGTAAASIQFVCTMDFNDIDEFGVETGRVDNCDLVIAGSYGFYIMPKVALGASIKGFYSRLYIYQKAGVAADAGVFVELGSNPDTRAGAVIQNIGFQSAYVEISDPLPSNIKAGLSTKFKVLGVASLLFSVDVNRLFGKDEVPTLDFGAEAQIYDIFVARAGYGFRHDLSGLSTGIGVLLDKIRFSYAYQPFGNLGTAHRITLDMQL